MKMKFFRKTLSFFIVPVMIPILILGMLSGITLNHYMRQGIDARYEDRLESHRTRIDAMMSELDWLNMNLSNNPSIQFRLKNIISKCKDGIPANTYDEINTIMDLLYGSYNANTAVESIYIYFNNAGRQFISSTNRITNLDYFFDQDWYDSYQTHIGGPEQTWSEFRQIDPYNFAGSTREIFTIYRKIFSPGKQTPEGVIVLNVRGDHVNRTLNELVGEENHLFFVTDGEGRVIFRNRQSESERAESILAAGNVQEARITGQGTYRVYRQESGDLEWNYCLAVPGEVAYQVPNRLTRMAAGLICLALFLSTATSYFFARKNYKSLMGIVDIFDKATHGQELPALPQRITDVYNYILYNIVETFLQNDFLQVQLSERRYKLKAMELMALQSQINPHFLMNTLQTVYWRCISLTQGPNPATEMLENLSEILHYSLESSQELVPLKEEVNITRCYLDIQVQRYKNQFDVIWDVWAPMETVMVPKLIIQPLIENSIYHGIRDKAGHSTIKIKIGVRDGWVTITVLDNGLGMDQKRLEQLKKRLEEEDTQEGVHIGLLNTHKRLELIYGGDYKIRLLSRLGRGTMIELKIRALPWDGHGGGTLSGRQSGAMQTDRKKSPD